MLVIQKKLKNYFNNTSFNFLAIVIFHIYALLRCDFNLANISIFACLSLSISSLILFANNKVYTIISKLLYAFIGFVLIYELINLLVISKPSPLYTSIFFRNINLIATFFVAVFFLFLINLKLYKKPIIVITISILIFLFLLLLQSRAALLSFIICLILYLMVFFSKDLKRIKLYLAVIISFAILLITFKNSDAKRGSINGRYLINKICLISKENILFGSGTGTFQNIYPKLQKEYLAKSNSALEKTIADNPIAAFNELLQVKVELGIIGLILISIIIFPLNRLNKIKKSPELLVLHSIFINSLFSYSFHNIILLIMFSIIYAQSNSIQNKYDRKTNIALNIIGIIFLFIGICLGALSNYINLKKSNLFKESNFECKKIKKQFEHIYPYYSNDLSTLNKYSKILLFDCNESQNCISLLEKTNKNGMNYENLLLLSESYLQAKQLDSAIVNLKLASEYLPYKFMPYYYLQEIYLTKKDTTNAKIVANKILTLPIKISSVEIKFSKEKAIELLRNFK